MNNVLIDHRGDLEKHLIEHNFGERTSLPLGDVQWETAKGLHIAELKNAIDLLNSLQSGHLQDQVARMERGEFVQRYLVVVGQLGPDPKGARAQNVFTSNAVTLFEGTKSITTKSVDQWESFSYAYTGVLNYFTHLEEDDWRIIKIDSLDGLIPALTQVIKRTYKPRRHRSKQKVAHGSLDPRANALRTIPGFQHLSSKSAEALIKKYGWRTPVDLGEADVKELMTVDGIGKVSAERLLS